MNKNHQNSRKAYKRIYSTYYTSGKLTFSSPMKTMNINNDVLENNCDKDQYYFHPNANH